MRVTAAERSKEPRSKVNNDLWGLFTVIVSLT